MAFGWDDIAVGGLSSVGGIIGGLISNQNSRSNADHAFNQMMGASNTAHQREVEDLKKAGLNPILSAGGSGAGTPNMTPSDSADLSGAVGTGINTAMAKKLQDKQVDKMDRENWALEKSAALDSAKAQTESYNRQLLRTQEQQTQANVDFQNLKNRFMKETLEAQIKEAKARGDWAQVNMLLGAINSTAKTMAPLAAP